jgi:hypothetical protein
LGQRIVPNGLLSTKFRYAAPDARLIEIDSDFGIRVSDRLIEIHAGPFLELCLKGIVGRAIEMPRPDRDRWVARRFEEFRRSLGHTLT